MPNLQNAKLFDKETSVKYLGICMWTQTSENGIYIHFIFPFNLTKTIRKFSFVFENPENIITNNAKRIF